MALHGAIAALDAVKSVSDMREDFFRNMVDLLIRDVQPLLDQVPHLTAENNVLRGTVHHLQQEVEQLRAKRGPKA